MENTPIEGLAPEQLRAAIEKVIADTTAAPQTDPLAGFNKPASATPAEPAAPPKFKVNLPDGREFEGTQDEINGAFNEVAQRIAAAQRPAEQKTVQADDRPAYNVDEVRAEFSRLAEKDPVAAFRYMDQIKYGTPDLGKVVQNLVQTVVSQNQEIVGLKFRDAHPEWEPTRENAEALQATLLSLNLPPTYEYYNAAYEIAKTQGKIKVKDAQAVQVPQQGWNQPAPRTNVVQMPPMVSRTQVTPEGPTEAEIQRRLSSMSADQLMELNRRLTNGEVAL